MPNAGNTRKPKKPPTTLKGWKAIGEYLGIGEATAQRWAKGGMPVKRQGRFTVANTEELREWLGKESHDSIVSWTLPATPREELTRELKSA